MVAHYSEIVFKQAATESESEKNTGKKRIINQKKGGKSREKGKRGQGKGREERERQRNRKATQHVNARERILSRLEDTHADTKQK